MREIRNLIFDRKREDSARAKQRLDAERWRDEVRPRAMRRFAARTAQITWSRALLKLVVGELYPDDLFTQLVGNLNRVPRRRWPQVLAIAVALRHSWRRDSLARIARLLTTGSRHIRRSTQRHTPSTHVRASVNSHRRVTNRVSRHKARTLKKRERE